MNRDSIFIEAFRLETFIGVYEWEKHIKQILLLDLEIIPDMNGEGFRKVSSSDVVSDSIDYSTVAERISVFVAAHHFQLLETLAEKIAQLLLNEFPVSAVSLRLKKPDALARTQSAGIAIHRAKNS